MRFSGRWAAVLALVAGFAGNAGAQSAGYPVEIGTQAVGLVHVSRQDLSSSTNFTLPGGGLLTLPTVYATIFVSPVVALEPEVAYEHQSSGGSSSWVGAALLRVGGYFSGARQDSPFLNGELGVLGTDGDSHVGFGVGGGYRWLVANRRLAIRLEGRVRRWQEHPRLTEVGAVLGVGVVLGH